MPLYIRIIYLTMLKYPHADRDTLMLMLERILHMTKDDYVSVSRAISKARSFLKTYGVPK